MLGRPEPEAGEGLLLEPCQAVHMYWMRYALDIAFLGPDGRIVAQYHDLEPGRVSGRHREADRALELPAGTLAAAGSRIGDEVEICGGDD